MKTFRSSRRSVRVAVATGLALLVIISFASAWGVDVAWDGGTAGTGTAWRTAANWAGDQPPGGADNAIFDAAGTVTICTIDMGAAGGNQPVGSITLGSGRSVNLSIRNLTSSSANGVLTLNGVGGILLSNEAALTLTITNGASGSTSLLGLQLAASGDIYVANNGQITIGSILSETGGSRGFTKRGPGILYLRANAANTYSGDTVNAGGTIRLNDTASFGTGTLYLSGGYIAAANTRASAPLANPVVMTTDAVIYGDSTLASERILPFSGSWSGNAGTLYIGNLASIAGSTFTLRLIGGGTFPRPISIGSLADTAGTLKILDLYNSITNGSQTFNSSISGDGIVRRSGATSSAGGTTAFTADNTYSGGTLITYGTLLANNSTGSALGSGAVGVTNQGILGGNGTVVAATSVSLGGALSPGSASTNVGNLKISDLTLGEGGAYVVNITSATGTPGAAWDLVTAGGGGGTWVDAATSVNPFTIKLDSLGAAPAGWNSTVARDWVILDGGAASGFDASHFALDTAAFAGAVAGVFSLSVVSGDLHLTYTPAPDVVLNVPSGTQTQGQLGYAKISGTVGMVKVGNGEAVIDNALNDFAGSTRIHAGTLSLAVDAFNGSGGLGNATTALLLGNTTGNSNATLNLAAAGITQGRGLVVQSGSTGTKSLGTSLTSGTATNAGDISMLDDLTVTAASGGVLVITGTLTGTNAVTKTGPGVVAFNAANTYSGKTRILDGTLSIDAAGRLGALPSPAVEDQITLDGGTLEFMTGTVASGSGRGFRLGNGGGTFSVLSGTLSLSGAVSGPGQLVKTGPSRLELNSATNSYAGDTWLIGGEIGLDDDGSLGAGTLRLLGGGLAIQGSRSTTANFIPNAIVMTNDTVIRSSGGTSGSSRIAVFSGSDLTTTGGTLTLTNGAATVTTNTFDVRFVGSGFNFTRPIVLDGGVGQGNSVQLFLGNSNGTAQTFSGLISGNGRVRRSGVTASDAGAAILTAPNTYTGGTVVFGGTLLANNSSGSATGPGAVLVTNLGTLSGTGTVAGPVTAMTSGAIAPGISAGTLTLQNGFDASAGGTYVWELAANSTSGPGVNYDVLAVTGGNVVLGGTSKLALSFTGAATAPDAANPFWQSARSWTVLTVGDGAANPGLTAFASITNSYAAGSFTNYADATGNIVLAFAPSSLPPQPEISPNVAGAGTANATLSWSALDGTTYTVQYKTNLNQPGWLPLGTATGSGGAAAFTDTTGPHPERYYRIIWP